LFEMAGKFIGKGLLEHETLSKTSDIQAMYSKNGS
jgi:hypothetical protein